MIRNSLAAVPISLLAAATAFADPVPIEPGNEPSPWTLPIAAGVLIVVAALIVIWHRRR